MTQLSANQETLATTLHTAAAARGLMTWLKFLTLDDYSWTGIILITLHPKVQVRYVAAMIRQI